MLKHDLIKSYVRLPDLQQKRMVEFAHSIGVRWRRTRSIRHRWSVSTTPSIPAATSRRGYSPKQAPLQTAYEDVVQLFGKSERIFCPMIAQGGTRQLFIDHPALKNDPRFGLYPGWIQRQVANQPGHANAAFGGTPGGAVGWSSIR